MERCVGHTWIKQAKRRKQTSAELVEEFVVAHEGLEEGGPQTGPPLTARLLLRPFTALLLLLLLLPRSAHLALHLFNDAVQLFFTAHETEDSVMRKGKGVRMVGWLK